MSKHREKTVRAVAIAALVLVQPLTLPAQEDQPPAAFGERVEVEVVNVDVVVADRDGNRVYGLGREDFELLVDGKPVPVDYFAAPAAVEPRPGPEPALPGEPAPPPAATPEAAPPAPSLLVVYVDQSALERRIRQRTIEALEQFVTRREPDERIMIAAFEDELRIFAEPTVEPLEIHRGFDQLADLPARADLVTAERNRLEQEVRVTIDMAATASDFPTATGGEPGEAEVLRVRAEIERWAEQELDRQLRSLQALQKVVGALAGIEGRKAAVLATGGYSPDPASYLLRFLADKQGLVANRGQITRVPRLDELGVRVGAAFEALVHAAQDARVVFHTVMPTTPPPESNDPQFRGAGAALPTATPRDFARLDAASSAVRMAAATGGRALVADEELVTKLAGVRHDVEATYSLGFTTGPEAGAGDHQIDVRVRQEGLLVRHRETFRRSSFAERARQALLAAASLGQVENPARVEVEPGEPGRSRRKGAVTVPVTARIPLAEVALLPTGKDRAGNLEITFAVRTGEGQVVAGDPAVVPISVPGADLERALASVWPHRGEVRVTPGRNRIAALVVDAAAGTYSTAAADLEIGR